MIGGIKMHGGKHRKWKCWSCIDFSSLNKIYFVQRGMRPHTSKVQQKQQTGYSHKLSSIHPSIYPIQGMLAAVDLFLIIISRFRCTTAKTASYPSFEDVHLCITVFLLHFVYSTFHSTTVLSTFFIVCIFKN